MAFVDLFISTLTQGFIYALLSYGVYITYKILDFPDLTVDGSFPLGAAITAVLLVNGVNPYLAMLASIAAGAIAGLATGVIHVKLGVRDLLAGIITMTALFSINLQIAGSNLSLIIALLFKLILDWYLRTKSGLLLRAVGDNCTLVTTLAKDKGTVKIIGLVIANALVALSGSIVCQEQRAFSSTMGTGQVVFGLATVIVGTTLFRKMSFVKGTTAVLVGSVFYKICIQIAISLGLPANLLKLATAVLFLVVLVVGNRQKGGAEHA